MTRRTPTAGHSGGCRQRGVTIIEVMVAVLLGLFLTGAIVSAFVATGRHYAQDEQIGRMQESARFALRFLAEDLSLVDFWGFLLDPTQINASVRTCADTPEAAECNGFFASSTLTLTSDCKPASAAVDEHWVYDISQPIEILREATDGTAANDAFSCIEAAEFQPGTDVVSLKHVRGKELASTRTETGDNGNVYMRTNGETGMLHVYDTGTNGSLVQSSSIGDWQYMAHVYFIRKDSLPGNDDGVPTLYRRVLSGTEMQLESGGIARGIEFFRIMFGIDTDSDGIPNTYISDPDATQMAQAVTARIYVLARSTEPDYSYVNDKTYVLGDTTVSGGGDNFYRRVFSTTVKLRNPSNRIFLQLDA